MTSWNAGCRRTNNVSASEATAGSTYSERAATNLSRPHEDEISAAAAEGLELLLLLPAELGDCDRSRESAQFHHGSCRPPSSAHLHAAGADARRADGDARDG